MNLDAVLKIGGSLSRGSGLADLCQAVSRLGKNHALLVVPGGGKFADQVRKAYRQYDLDETAAHRMALLAMDQYGYLLNKLIAGSFLVDNLTFVCQASESGRVAILLPSAPVMKADSLPHSWQVTSDTIAAWVAHMAGCRRLVLLKDVDGLLTSGCVENSSAELIAELTVEQLAEHAAGVDEYLSSCLGSTQLETWVINGLRPERMFELLDAAQTIGTRIMPARRR